LSVYDAKKIQSSYHDQVSNYKLYNLEGTAPEVEYRRRQIC